LRLSSFGGYGLALAALALMVFGAIECPPFFDISKMKARLRLSVLIVRSDVDSSSKRAKQARLAPK